MKDALGKISEIQVGYQSREGIRAQADGSYFLLQARDLDKLRQIDWSNLTRFTPSGAISKSEIRQSDVLFLARGQDNFAYLISHDTRNVLASNSFYILRAKTEIVLPEFLAWWLNQTPAQEYIKLNRSGSSLPFLSVSALSCLEVPIPVLEMQRKIGVLEMLRKKEADLLDLYLTKKSALVEAVCLNAIIE
ncbi:MAG: hypothetical protein WA110_05655 [Anaerolineaceae bacterium]